MTGRTQTHSVVHDALERRFLVHIPPGHATESRPVVMFLHGAGATSRWALAETRLATTADLHGFVAVLPDALPRDLGQPPEFLRNPQVWAAGRGPAILKGHDHDDVGFLAAVLDDLGHHAVVDEKRIYLTGFSNGAAMAFRLAASLSHRIAAVAPVAGYCLEQEPRPERPVPTLYVVGDRDPLVPLAGGLVMSPWTGKVEHRPPVQETLTRWARAIGAVSRPTSWGAGCLSIDEYAANPGGAAMTAVVIGGLGHHWPGGRGQLKRSLAGEAGDQVSANEMLWDFFRKHRL